MQREEADHEVEVKAKKINIDGSQVIPHGLKTPMLCGHMGVD